MLLQAEPLTPLRLGIRRAVLNSVLFEHSMLHTEQEREALLQHCKENTSGHARVDAGDVSTFGFYDRGNVQDAAFAVLGRVRATLEAYGFLAPKDSHFEMEAGCMASRGSWAHNDVHNSEWHETLFWVYVLHAENAELAFPNLGIQEALQEGLLVVFDPAQPHAVWAPGKGVFRKTDFKARNLQYYLAGSCKYDAQGWKKLGVPTAEHSLRRAKQLKDIMDFRVDEITGELKN